MTYKFPPSHEVPGGEYETILEALSDYRVFTILTSSDKDVDPGKFRFEEGCDNYLYLDLTPDQMLILADEIRALALRGKP